VSSRWKPTKSEKCNYYMYTSSEVGPFGVESH
jgi:hypothetical protein